MIYNFCMAVMKSIYIKSLGHIMSLHYDSKFGITGNSKHLYNQALLVILPILHKKKGKEEA